MAEQRWWKSAPDVDQRHIGALIVGHITRDLLPDGGWRPGGAALYAGVTARQLGMRPGIVTSAPPDLCVRAMEILGDVPMVAVPADEATTYENIYTPTGRVQYVRARARTISAADIPPFWRKCAVALLAPVAGEVAPSLADSLHAPVIGAAPQGWLREWDADGRVRPRDLTEDEAEALGRLSALVLSREDLTGPGADSATLAATSQTLAEWSRLVPSLVVTRGPEGADLWRAGVAERHPGCAVREVDPTGAGDVFAMSFVGALGRGGEAGEAVDFANRVAALSVEGEGHSAIPTPQQIAARYPMSKE
ncbi:MAG TPA: PfkB family carbohydrate kinase [Ktedonobacterales bacterium]|nr:PfkB family carbohydrate kinase [Ktedonobacterales bacterium]